MPDTAQNYFSSVLIGVIDGIIIPLTLFCFLTGLGKQPLEVWDYTLYVAIGAAVLLALGGFFTRREEQSHTHEKRILKVYQGLDVADEIKSDLIKDAQRESDEWKNEWSGAHAQTTALPPFSYAIFIFIGYLIGGIIVLVNALKFTPPSYLFFIVPVLLLIIAGFIKYRMFGRPAIGGMLLTGGAGLAASLGAYWIATLL